MVVALFAGGCSAPDREFPITDAPAANTTSDGADAASADASAPPPTVLIVDSSGSMATADAPGPRFEAAATAVNSLIDGLPNSTELGLVTYGGSSREADGPASCKDISSPVSLGKLDRPAIKAATNALRPGGWTPIGESLRLAGTMLKTSAGAGDQRIVLVSDGESTCEPPPCDAARELKNSAPGLLISTIGFRSDAAELACIAQATGGLSVTADNAAQLTARLAAVQDVKTAKQSLTGRMLAGIEVGASYQAISKALPDVPAIDASCSCIRNWKSARWNFDDQILAAIVPTDGGRTVDGIAPGATVADVVALYGEPLGWEAGENGAQIATFIADESLGTVWRMICTGTSPDSKVVSIELWRYTSSGKQTDLLNLITPRGKREPFPVTATLAPTPSKFSRVQRFALDSGLVTSAYGNSDSAFLACWKSGERQALCTSSIRDQLFYTVTAKYQPVAGLQETKQDKLTVVAAVLNDGRVCDYVGDASRELKTINGTGRTLAYQCAGNVRLWEPKDGTISLGNLPEQLDSTVGESTLSSPVAVRGFVEPKDVDVTFN